MKRPPALIFSEDKRDKEKYLRFGLLLFLCFYPFFALSENVSENNTGALFQKTPDTPSKKLADSLFQEISIHIRAGNFAHAETLAQESLELYRSLDNKSGEGNALNKIGTISYYIADFTKALEYYDRSIVIYRSIDFKKGVASSLNNKGAIFYHLGNYLEALNHYKQAVQINEELGNKKQEATALRNIGGIYAELDELGIAMTYLQTARDTYELLDLKQSAAQTTNSIGEIFIRQGDYQSAQEHIACALQTAQEVEDKQQVLYATFSLATLKSERGKYAEAIRLYENVLKMAVALSNERYKALAQTDKGIVQAKSNKYAMSLANCLSGLKLAENLKLIATQRDACNCLYNAYKVLDRPEKALAFYEKSTNLTDSLKTRKTANQMLSMEFEKEQLLDSIVYVQKERQQAQAHREVVLKKEQQRNILIISSCFVLVIAGGLWNKLNFTKKSKAILQVEKDRSEHLLLNILPEEIADELKAKGYVDAQDFDTATILFTDFKSFTETASKLTPQELVEEINTCFKAFDAIMETYGIEKIKTIGDAYMAAGGLPKPDANAVKNTILAALEMQAFIIRHKQDNHLINKPAFDMRVGIHVGPIVAGIVGVKKFQYDVWGDTVNTASRMESNGEVGKVNISQDTYDLIKDEDDFSFEYRGKIKVKGKGELAMYFVSNLDV